MQDEATGSGSSSSPRASPYRAGRSAAAGTDREISRDQLSASGDDGESNGNGRIEFNLKYDSIESTLTLKVIRAVELPAKDFISGTSDPYVKIMLLPEKGSKMSTSIKRRNLNPRWNEIFAFEGNFSSKLSFVLLFTRLEFQTSFTYELRSFPFINLFTTEQIIIIVIIMIILIMARRALGREDICSYRRAKQPSTQ